MSIQDKEIQKIEFSKNWNNKLLCFCFTTIRPQSEKYVVGDVFEIRLSERHFCYAKVIDIKKETIDKIVSLNYNIIDTGLNKKDFIELMERFYSKKTWWKQNETTMQIVFFEKVVQLEMFSDNEQLTKKY